MLNGYSKYGIRKATYAQKERRADGSSSRRKPAVPKRNITH